MQGQHRLAYVTRQGHLLYGFLDPLGPLLVLVVGVAFRWRCDLLLAERVSGLLLAIVLRVELLPVDALGEVPVCPVVFLPEELRAPRVTCSAHELARVIVVLGNRGLALGVVPQGLR